MLNTFKIDDSISKEENILQIKKTAESICEEVFQNNNSFQFSNYKYDYSIPANELGLEEELIAQLIEDYISQVFSSYKAFNTILEDMIKADKEHLDECLIELKNLAHKNIGVAKNLRIQDAQILLVELMNNCTDVKYLKKCIDALMSCAFKLNPTYAFDVLKLKHIKNKL
jgi:hypothetical protein